MPVWVNRGRLDEAKRSARFLPELKASADLQEQAQAHFAEATLLLAEGKHADALRSAEASLATRDAMGCSYEAVKESFVVAVEASLALGDVSRTQELLTIVDKLPPGRSTPFLQGHSSRFRARLAASSGNADEADRLFNRAAGVFRELAIPFYLGVTLLEQGEWLVAEGNLEDAEPLLAEARKLFERLEARPWLERTAALRGSERQAEVVS